MQDTLAPAVVVPRLRGGFGHPYLYAEVCASTQQLFGPGHAEGAVAATEEQTEGRGRLGRTWLSPPRASVLCSVLLEPAVETPRLPELSIVAGEACAAAIAEVTGLAPAIKLPNDLLIEGRKTAGILAEARDGRVIVGIGVNVNLGGDDLPEGVAATSLLVETGRVVDRVEVLVALLDHLERRYVDWACS